MKSTYKFAIVAVLGVVAGAGTAWLNHTLRHHSDERQAGGSIFARIGFAPGMAIGTLVLTGADGGRHLLKSLVAGSDETVLHFVDRNCSACTKDLDAWEEAARVASVPVLLIACNDSDPLGEISQPNSLRLYALGPADSASGPRAVPATIVVNNRGKITGAISGLEAFSKRWVR